MAGIREKYSEHKHGAFFPSAARIIKARYKRTRFFKFVMSAQRKALAAFFLSLLLLVRNICLRLAEQRVETPASAVKVVVTKQQGTDDVVNS